MNSMSSAGSSDVRRLLARIQEVTEFLGVELNDVNQRGIFGNTPLKVAVVWRDEDAVKTLLDAGADVNARCEDGYSALHTAAASGDVGICKLLIARGARISERNDNGETPRALAQALRHEAIVELLCSGQ